METKLRTDIMIKTINIHGPEGNAFYLIGLARKTAKALGYTPDEIEKLCADMSAGDYEHLLGVFEEHFRDVYILNRDEPETY
jgi:hypothetical protein